MVATETFFIKSSNKFVTIFYFLIIIKISRGDKVMFGRKRETKMSIREKQLGLDPFFERFVKV